MKDKKRKLTDIQILSICHFVGLVAMSFFGANVFELVENLSGNTATYMLLPINRSMWEFSKMLLGPISIIFFIEYFIVGRRMKKFIPAHLAITALLPLVSVGIFSFFNYILGSISMQGAQAVMFVSLVLAALLMSILLVTSDIDLSRYTKFFLVLYIVMCVSYAVFSFVRPPVRMFFDFDANTYGPIH